MPNKKNNQSPLDFSSSRVLVLGDVMLDKYLLGHAPRISPEAPVPIVHIDKTFMNLGGAGNVAMNLASLGAKVTLIGLVGKDEDAENVKLLAEKYDIDGILLEVEEPTITKTRIIAGHQQVVRIDREKIISLDEDEIRSLLDITEGLIGLHDVLVISDYAKGTVHSKLIKKLIAYCNKKQIPVLVDPKSSDWKKYAGADYITPNLKELGEYLGIPILNTNDEVEKAAKKALKASGMPAILITRSDKGMTFVNGKTMKHIAAQAREVYDVSGAGDTVIAVLAATIAAGWNEIEAIKLANLAAGTVVSKAGTVPVKLDELNELWKS
ncbi:MAG: D-glycero-beta-D-manno-heptose-7-phosphate kinase [Flavobacteriales bacterium]|nr:D-glycero-beta-D-manno-heptose-7-phosphate kinase [Flavobacteriales bacterium]